MEGHYTLITNKENQNSQDNGSDKISVIAALFKVSTKTVIDKDLTAVLFKEYNASPVIIKKEHTIFEVLSNADQMNKLKLYLKDNGLIEFIMSNTIVL